MKTISLFLLLFVLLSACSPGATIGTTQTATLAPLPSATVEEVLEPTATEVVVSDTPAALDFDSLVPEAQTFLDELDQGDFAAAFARFDDTMKGALPEDKLEELWVQLESQVGAYQEMTGVHTEMAQGYYVVTLTSQFEKALLDVRVVFDSQGRIAGLFFNPAQQEEPAAYTPPEYVDPQSFTEQELTLGSGEWALPATLTLPVGGTSTGSSPFPAIILVHGSGPHDEDETIGPNLPFRDLAWGLASRGIAVLRYVKRTQEHAGQYTGETLANLTLQDETIDDALLAAELLRQTEGIDPERVFVLGHSLGAMAAPRIGEQDPNLAGLVLLAGPSRPLEDLVLDQVNYLFELQGSPEDGQAEMDALATQVALVKDPALSVDTPSEDLLLDLTPAYWGYLGEYDQVATAQSLAMPMLILQGARDYQVLAEKDFTGWQAALQDRLNVVFKLYPDLNHLFMTGEGFSTPDEYNLPGHVSQQVIEDIAAWINP